MHGLGDSKSSEKIKYRCYRMARWETNCGSVTKSRLNKNHPASKCHGSPICGSHTDKIYCV
jgi:hypothetical protein